MIERAVALATSLERLSFQTLCILRPMSEPKQMNRCGIFGHKGGFNECFRMRMRFGVK